MTDDVHTEIAIVGGGLMGATLALLLARVRPDCRILLCEKSPFTAATPDLLKQPSFDARSTALAPTSVELLQTLGVWQRLPMPATAIRKIHVSDRGHLGWVALGESDNQSQPLGYVVENRSLGWSLTQAMAAESNLQIRAPMHVARVQAKSRRARLLCQGQESSIDARLVIIADGADSPLRQQLGIQTRVRDYHQNAIVANVACSKAHNGQAFERFTAQGPLALLPLQGEWGKSMAMVWTRPEAEVDTALALSDQAFLSELQQVFGYRLGELSAVSQRFSYPLQLLVAEEQVRSNIVLMGNAAHFLHPVAGQGYNLAARDGLRLAETLRDVPAEGLGELSVLHGYLKAQRPDQERTLSLSDGFNRLFGERGWFAAAMRNSAMFAVHSQPLIRSMFIRQMSGRASPKAQPWGTH